MTSALQKPAEKVWVALRFPAFVLNAQGLVGNAQEPIMVTEKQKIIYANASARKTGIRLGMDITTAKLLSNCQEYERNISAEEAAIKMLKEMAYHFSPYIETCESPLWMHKGLLLEVSTCLTLFSGITSFIKTLKEAFAKTRYKCCIGLGHTSQAAWLLSFKPYDITGTEKTPLFIERLAALPIHLLHDHLHTVDALEKTGFKTLGDIIRQIEAGSLKNFKRRYGEGFAHYLSGLFDIDQNFQQSSLFDKPVDIYKPIEFFNETFELEYPTNNSSFLAWPMENLLQQLAVYLRKRQWETQQIEWTFSDIYGGKDLMQVHSDSPQSHWQLLYDLSLIQLENRALNFEVDKLSLCCRQAHGVQNRNHALVFDQGRKHSNRSQSFALSAAKLKARLGESALYKLTYRDSFLPEVCNQKIPLAETCNQTLPHVHQAGLRPNWLLPQPVALELRKQGLYWRGYLELIAGPERIYNGWWQESTARDYFVAKRSDHMRLWIYRDLRDKQWYVQGIFG